MSCALQAPNIISSPPQDQPPPPHVAHHLYVCRACEATASAEVPLLDLLVPANRSLLRKLRTCVDTHIDTSDVRLPRHLCTACAASVEAAHRFRIRCEYTEQKWLDALAAVAGKATTVASSTQERLVTDDGINVEVLEEDEPEAATLEKDEQQQQHEVVASNCDDQCSDEYFLYEDPGDDESTAATGDKPLPDDSYRPVQEAAIIDSIIEQSDSEDAGGFSQSIICHLPNVAGDEEDQNIEYIHDAELTHGSHHGTTDDADRSEDDDYLDDDNDYHDADDPNDEQEVDAVPTTDNLTPLPGNVARPFQCPTCAKTFSKRYHLKNHQTIHAARSDRFACKECGRRYSNQGNLDRHVRVYHRQQRSYGCQECGKSFSQSWILKQHQAVHTDAKQFECDLCQKRFKTREYLQLHRNRHVTAVTARRRAPRPAPKADTAASPASRRAAKTKQICQCVYCGKISTSMALHVSHQRTHTGEKPYECRVCQKRFSFQQSLRTHQLMHTGEKPFRCDECGLQFRQIGHLIGHRLTHTGSKKHECPYCPKTFALRSNLTVHMRLHTGDTPYHCGYCAKKFNDSNGLKRHLLAHERNGDNTALRREEENAEEEEEERRAEADEMDKWTAGNGEGEFRSEPGDGGCEVDGTLAEYGVIMDMDDIIVEETEEDEESAVVFGV